MYMNVYVCICNACAYMYVYVFMLCNVCCQAYGKVDMYAGSTRGVDRSTQMAYIDSRFLSNTILVTGVHIDRYIEIS